MSSLLRIACLGSGSKGNAALIRYGNQALLLDNGFSARELSRRAEPLGFDFSELTAILVTHEHQDHSAGVGVLARKLNIPVYLTSGTQRVLGDKLANVQVQRICPNRPFDIGDIVIQPYPVPHDAAEPCQFVFSVGGLKVGFLSDTGHITAHIRDVLADCSVLYLECNHDPKMLEDGPYPDALKWRVGGNRGHLSNQQSAAFLKTLPVAELQQLVITHMSETNNCPDAINGLLGEIPDLSLEKTHIAPQSGDQHWMEYAA